MWTSSACTIQVGDIGALPCAGWVALAVAAAGLAWRSLHVCRRVPQCTAAQCNPCMVCSRLYADARLLRVQVVSGW